MVFHTHISGLERPKTSNSMVGVMFPVEQEDNNKQLYIKIHKRNRQGKIFFSLLFITFFIGFSSRAMHVYYNAAVNEDNI